MKVIKSFYKGAFLIALVVFLSCLIGGKIYESSHKNFGNTTDVQDTDFGLFLAAQHALSVNDFDNAEKMLDVVKSDNKVVKQTKIMTDFFSGKMPQNASSLKDSKDLTEGFIYDAYLIQNDKWGDLYKRHSKDTALFYAPLRIISAVKQGRVKEAEKFVDSLQTNDYWKAFIRGQIAVLNKDIDKAAKEFAKVHPDFMNINDYLYLMSFYRANEMFEDMDILRDDFVAKPGGLYVLDYQDVPDWSQYEGFTNGLVFNIIQTVSHTQVMIYTDMSLMLLRFAEIISNNTNTDSINYYLGQYYSLNKGDFAGCFNKISTKSPFYPFGQLKIADKTNNFTMKEKIVHDSPLFISATNAVVREDIKQGDKRSALKVLNRAIKQQNLNDNGRIFLLKQRAYLYLMFNQPNRAQKDLDAALDIHDDLASDNMFLQAYIWALQKDKNNLDRAYKYAMSLIKANTSDVKAWDLLGIIVSKKEGLDNGIEILERITASPSATSSLYYHLGDMYKAKGDKEKALRAYTRALDLSEDGLVIIPFVQKKIRKVK